MASWYDMLALFQDLGKSAFLKGEGKAPSWVFDQKTFIILDYR